MIVLVHGAWHAASSWAGLESELAARGERSLAVDLPAEDPACGAGEYAAAVLAGLGPSTETLVLVGHSLGGLTVPVVAQQLLAQAPDRARLRALVLLAALVPRPGMSYNDQLRADRSIMAAGFGVGQDRHPDGTTSWSRQAALDGLLRGVADEVSHDVVEQAADRLRPQAWAIAREVTPLTAWPPVPTVSVVCGDDQVVDPAWSRRAAGEIGATVVELAGGHFPMLTRPGELADLLVGIARG